MSLLTSIRTGVLGLTSLLALSFALPAMAMRPADPADPAAKPAVQRDPNAIPRGAVITMGERGDKDMVGIYMTAEILDRILPLLEEEKIDIVVFRFYSGGGFLLEIKPLSDIIQTKYKKKFHSVAWIESAISAAAMTAHTFNDIYFTTQANYGACTGFAGSLDRPMTGLGLEQVLALMEVISDRGGHDTRIMRAMQISSNDEDIADLKISLPSGALSASIDEKSGDVTWYQDSISGKHVVNPMAGRRILTFNSQTAAQFKFSKGTADTLSELTNLLGYKEIEWVGQKTGALLWPVCKAEKKNMDFRSSTKRDEDLNAAYFRQYTMNLAAAEAAPIREDRLRFLNKAKQGLEKLAQMLRNNPNMAYIVMNMEPADALKWVEEQRKIIKDLSK